MKPLTNDELLDWIIREAKEEKQFLKQLKTIESRPTPNVSFVRRLMLDLIATRNGLAHFLSEQGVDVVTNFDHAGHVTWQIEDESHIGPFLNDINLLITIDICLMETEAKAKLALSKGGNWVEATWQEYNRFLREDWVAIFLIFHSSLADRSNERATALASALTLATQGKVFETILDDYQRQYGEFKQARNNIVADVAAEAAYALRDEVGPTFNIHTFRKLPGKVGYQLTKTHDSSTEYSARREYQSRPRKLGKHPDRAIQIDLAKADTVRARRHPYAEAESEATAFITREELNATIRSANLTPAESEVIRDLAQGLTVNLSALKRQCRTGTVTALRSRAFAKIRRLANPREK